MEQYFKFLLQVSLGIIIFYSLYWIFLRNETYYRANRFFLIGTLLIAVILPLFPFRYTVLMETETNTGIFETIGNSFKKTPAGIAPEAGSNASLNFIQIASIIYLTGISIFLFRLIIQTVILIHLIIKYKIKSLNGIRIVENKKYGLPFSFFNIVFINPKFHTQEDLPEILAHEQVHISENHWADLLIIELLTVILWFNPFIWFFERSIKQNHEYLADRAVISNGNSVAKYQALLVNQLMGMQIIGITNNLNFALNKNRLKMMTKQKTPKIRAVKMAWALPAIALLLVAFAEPRYEAQMSNQNSDEAHKTEIKEAVKVTIHGKVVRELDGKPMPGAAITIKGTAIGTVADHDGTFTLVNPNPEIIKGDIKENVSYRTEVVVSYVGYKNVYNTLTVSGEAIKNGKFVFKMEEGVIKLDLKNMLKEVPPPPLPPKDNKVEKIAKTPNSDVPPPPAKKSNKEFYIMETLPVYPGGSSALAEFILISAEKYAKAKNIEGKATVGFTVSETGKVENIHLVEKDNDMAGKAAYAIISDIKDWKPGTQRGKKVPVNYMIPIEF